MATPLRTELEPPVDPMLPRPFRVARSRRETVDTQTLELEPVSGPPLAFAPGQFNMLYLFGVGEVPISISGNPARTSALVHTLRSVGAVTKGLAALKRGETLGVRGPFGVGWPVSAGQGGDVLIVAGGIGLAPLRPAIYHLLTHRQSYGRISVLVGARSPQDLLFQRELERWRAHFDLQVEVTVDHAHGDWSGHVGVVTLLIPRAAVNPGNTVVMTCGPEVMMRFVVRELTRRGYSPERIFVSMERNMKCGVGLCGHCQYGPTFVCKDGPVFPFARVAPLFEIREV